MPIFDSEADDDEANYKLLCTMSAHTGQPYSFIDGDVELIQVGSVLCVRWAHHGRFLATGSDDTVIVIWGIDP